jgi:hypothetical protein
LRTISLLLVYAVVCLSSMCFAAAPGHDALPPAAWQELAQLTASDGPQTFESVAIDGNTLVVGAPNETIGGNVNQGAAYVFVKPPSGWSNMTQVAKLTASDGTANADFGGSVAISGGTIVIGAIGAVRYPRHNVGAAYVFIEPQNGWSNTTETAELKRPHDSATGGHFGNAVATDGTTIAVGNSDYIGAGSVLVFVKPSTGWKTGMMYQALLTAHTDETSIGFGNALALSGGTLVVGAPYGTLVDVGGPGEAFVYVEPPTGWVSGTQTAKLTASNAQKNAYFGWAVAITNSTIAIGAPQVQWEHGTPGPGGVYVFIEPTNGWADMTETAELRASDGQKGDFMGGSVALNGSAETLWAGASGRNSVQGAVYVFVKPTNGWTTTSMFNTEIPSPGPPSFGAAVSVSGDTEVLLGDTIAFVFGPQ